MEDKITTREMKSTMTAKEMDKLGIQRPNCDKCGETKEHEGTNLFSSPKGHQSLTYSCQNKKCSKDRDSYYNSWETIYVRNEMNRFEKIKQLTDELNQYKSDNDVIWYFERGGINKILLEFRCEKDRKIMLKILEYLGGIFQNEM